MFDNLLKGNEEELKQKIDQLEQEKEELEEKLDKEQQKRKSAVSEHQEAREQINTLEDRLEGLQGQLNALQNNNETTVEFQQKTTLTPTQKQNLLDWLDNYKGQPESAFTAYIPETPNQKVRDAIPNKTTLLRRASPCIVLTDEIGAIQVALDAPVYSGTPFAEWNNEFRLEEHWFKPTGNFTFALLRSDTLVFGEYENAELVNTERVGSSVQNNHSKGGFSQGRFENRRDEQIKEHLKDAREALQDREYDELILVGDEQAIQEFEDEATVTDTTDVTGNTESDLKQAASKFWSTTLYRL